MNYLLKLVDSARINTYVVGLSIDMKGVWWPGHLKMLKDIGIPIYLWRIFFNYFSNRKVVYELPGELFCKNINKGWKLDSVCGPVLWDIYFEPSLLKLEDLDETLECVAYAYDHAVVVAGNSRKEIQNKLNRVLQGIKDWCIKNKMKISINKTKRVLLNGTLKRNPVIRHNRINI